MWQWLLSVATWVHLQLIGRVVRWWEEVVLSSWEEWLLALVRQGFEETIRFLNGLGTWFLSLFSHHSYRDQLRRSWQENSWQQWWGEVATRPSTLNALVANLVAQQQQQAHPGQQTSTEYAVESKSCLAPRGPDGSQQNSQQVPYYADKAGVGVAPRENGTFRLNTHAGCDGARNAGHPPASTSMWWLRKNGRIASPRLPGGASVAARMQRPVVFVQQSGMGILDELAKRRHGLIEDARMASQLAVSRAFELARSTVRAIFFLPSRESLAAHPNGYRAETPPGSARTSADGSGTTVRWRHSDGTAAVGTSGGRVAQKAHLQRSKSAHVNIAEMAYKPGAGAGASSSSMARRGLRRSHSFGRMRSGTSAPIHHVTEVPSDALSIIRAAGYPHELHTVTTADGYVLRMERIPRPAARDVVFFMHGVLDTSMAWVSGGVTGSQAFAAWEAGMDVWLGNSRGNAPRQHSDPARRGGRYWQYNINHMGMYDIAAQLDHIHNTKCAELGAGSVSLDLDHLGPLAPSFLGGAGAAAAAQRGLAPGGAASAAGCLLPRQVASTCLQQHTSAGQSRGPAVWTGTHGGQSAGSRMRHSNSDGNLYRWGSCGSASSGTIAILDGSESAGGGLAGRGSPSVNAGAATVPHAASSTTAAAALEFVADGRLVSSHSLLSPMPSCDGSEEGEDGSEQHPQPPPSPAARQRQGQRQPAHGRAAHRPGDDGSPAPVPVRRNAVTLTVMPPQLGAEVLGPLECNTPHRQHSVAAGRREPSAAAVTTFTLEAKTRTDFSSLVSTTSGGDDLGAEVDAEVGVVAGCPGDGGNVGAGGGAASAAASMLDAVGSVLGPAAEAVTHAVASAAATAGAALATAAVSATHLLQPSPQCFGGSSGAAAAHTLPPAVTSLTAASPFVSAAAEDSEADIERRSRTPSVLQTAPKPEASWRDTGTGSRASQHEPLNDTHPAGDQPLQEQLPNSQPLHHTAAATGRSPGAVGRSGPTSGSPGQAAAVSKTTSLPYASCFRRACSTDHLAAVTASNGAGAAVFTPSLPPAPSERTASSLSGGSQLSADGGDEAESAEAGSPPHHHNQGCDGGLREGRGATTAAPTAPPCPYKLRCVAHSLGGMSVLIHLINRLREGRPHHVNRLLLLTPAGFHKYCPKAARPVMWLLPRITWLLRTVLGRRFCFPLYIPTPLGRALTFKLLLSASRIPGLGELLRIAFKAMLDGDISQWDRALQMPHYSAEDMPAISVDLVLHLVQLVSTDAFRLYDYGSPSANMAHYGSPAPPDVSSDYWRLDLPVHLVAGTRDGIIPPPNIRRHLEAMSAQGVAVSYREFDFGHLDFTFGVKEELRMYLMKVLRR